MFDRVGLVITDQYLKAEKQWSNILDSGESLCVMFPYFSDREFRFKQYINHLEEKDDILAININPRLDSIEEIDDLKKIIFNQIPEKYRKENFNETIKYISKDIRILLVFSEGEMLFLPDYEYLLEIFKVLIMDCGNINIISAFETNIYNHMESVDRYNVLFQNISYYPLYNDKDLLAFIDYLCEKQPLEIPPLIKKSIVKNSGGFFWLAKEAFRIYRDKSDWNVNEYTFNLRINSIYKKFTKEEKNILSICPNLTKSDNSQIVNHLKKLLIIDEKNNIRIPELARIVGENSSNTKHDLLIIENEEITFKGISLSNILSATDYVILNHFLNNKNKTISRDEIAKLLWPKNTESHFSQWAIDQAIKRLRDRLITLRIPPTVIKSIRGVGYEYRT